MEREFIMVKPGALARGLLGEIISRIEAKGIRIIGMKMIDVPREKAEKQYAVHEGQPYHKRLIEYMTSGPVVAMVVEAEHAVKVIRKLVGKTDPTEAAPGTIRGDYAMISLHNCIHASDSPENAQMEYTIYFDEEEFVRY